MTNTAEIEVVSVGMLEVLSIGNGDLKIVVDGSDEDRENGRRVIEEMLRKGYGIFVETDDVIAHLTYMRGDEAGYWGAANHHEAWRPEAGL